MESSVGGVGGYFQNQWQFQNPLDEQIPKQQIFEFNEEITKIFKVPKQQIFEFNEEITKIFKGKGKAQFPKKQSWDKIKFWRGINCL